MNEQPNQINASPYWANLSAGILAGWLVFLFSVFLILIGASVLISSFGIKIIFGSTFFVVEAVIAGAISLSAAIFIGKRIYSWASRKSATNVYVLLSVLITVTLLSFPWTFMFKSVQDLPQQIEHGSS